jgi:hypothetical protein
MTQPTEGESLKIWETDAGSMSLSYPCVNNPMHMLVGPMTRTGTFFCEMTTAQSLPRTPNDVMFAAVIALNAYSVWPLC